MSVNTLRFHELLRLSLRTFRTKPERALLTVLGMSIGVGTVLLLISLGYGLQYILIGKLITTEDSLVTMEASYPAESNVVIQRPLIESIGEYDGVAEVSAIAEFPGEIRTEGISGLLVDTRIVEPSYFRLVGLLPTLGTIPTADGLGIVTSSQTLLPIGLAADVTSLGKLTTVNVFYEDDTEISSEMMGVTPVVPISGIIMDESMPPTAIIFANALSKAPPHYSKILVKADNIDVLEPVRDRLLQEGFLVSARVDLVTQARKITNIITIILGVFGITALFVSAIGMFNTMLVGFLERIYEVGILKSLGATDSDVRNLFLVEASIMGFLGGMGGIIIGYGIGQLLNITLSFFARRMGGESIDLFVTPWWFMGITLAISIAIGFISGYWPARRAAGLSPKEAFNKR